MPYIEGMDDAPGGLNESKAAIAAGLATAQSAYQVTQVVAATFIRENGHAVSSGHPPVNAPGRQGDPTAGVSDG
jgi:hypothetical protein